MLARVDFTLVLGRVNVAELFDVVRGHNAVAHVGHDHRPVLEAFDAVHRRAVHLVFAWFLLLVISSVGTPASPTSVGRPGRYAVAGSGHADGCVRRRGD